jgi:hypothetical protein
MNQLRQPKRDKAMNEQLRRKIASTSPVDPHERRKYVRHPFTATAEVVEIKSHARVSGRTSDLSLGGCYVDITSSFPAGSAVAMRITKDTRSVELQGVVVYSLLDMGMGVKFTFADPEQLRILEMWLGEISEESATEPVTSNICDQSCIMDSAEAAEIDVLREIVTELMKQGVLSSAKSEFMLQRLSRAGHAMPQLAATRVGVN